LLTYPEADLAYYFYFLPTRKGVISTISLMTRGEKNLILYSKT